MMNLFQGASSPLIPEDDRPRTRRSNCKRCGKALPEGTVRFIYELCLQCLPLNPKDRS